MKYISSKTYNQIGPVAYRQWRAESHCNKIHGYALSFYFEFESDTLDARNWVVDFGSLKPLKALLEDWFDHTLLVANDDPQREHLLNLGKLGLAKIVEVDKTGCEGLAEFLYTYINEQWLETSGAVKFRSARLMQIWQWWLDTKNNQNNVIVIVSNKEI